MPTGWSTSVPAAGEHGGRIVHSGTYDELLHNPNSLTGAYLSGKEEHRGPGHPAAGRPQAAAHGCRRARAQPARDRRVVPAGRAHVGHRRLGLRQVDTGQRHPGVGAGQQAQRRPPGAGPAHPRHRTGQGRQAGPRRPVADRPDAAIEPRHLHRCVRQDPHAVRRHHRGQGAWVSAGPILVQRQGRPLRGVLRRRHHQDRDELPARCVRAVRGLPRRAVQPGNPRGALQGQDHRRGARHVDRGRGRVLQADHLDPPVFADAGRRRAGLRAAGAAGADAVRR